MGKFLLKTLFFSFVGFFVLLGIDWWITEGVQNSAYEDVNTWNMVIHGGMSNDILILGSSRAYRHFDPLYIEEQLGLSAIILGNSDAKIDFLTFALNLYLEKNSKPQIIFWVLDFDSFEKSNEIQDYQKFLPFVSTNSVKEYLVEKRLISNLELMVPLSRYAHWTRLKWEGLKGKVNEGNWTRGFYPSRSEWDKEFDDKFRRNANTTLFFPDDSLIWEFQQRLKDLEQEGVKSIFILPPYLLKSDLQYLNQFEIVKSFKLIAKQINGDFLNYGESTIIDKEDYFYDFYHMNYKGVALFNEILIEDLKNILDLKDSLKVSK